MTSLDPATIARIDAHVDTLKIEDWPLPNAGQIDLLRRIFASSTSPGAQHAERDAA